MTPPPVAPKQKGIVGKLKELWFFYIIQTLAAVLVIATVTLCLGKEKTVLIGAMGATSFIVFAMPTTVSAKTTHIVGGHLVGVLSGIVLLLIPLPDFLSYGLAVGLAMFVMVTLDVEHPPAAGTALAVVINEMTYDAFAVIMTCAVLLSQCRYYLRHHLRDLI